ncbi:MAG: DNA translocase FtsK, partial [Mycoplasmataceae bacterium]|nr:DNA translocase FtsK [Mycoplasmataceae bacterium]
KLIDLRQKVIDKVKVENNKTKSNISRKDKNEIMSSLGYLSFSKLKTQLESRKIENIKLKNKFNSKLIEEELIEENISLINDGYKTTEEIYDISEPTLADDFMKDVMDEILASSIPTQEVPLLEKYFDEIFLNEKKLSKDINETFETIIKSGNESIKEIIITDLSEEITLEEYISLPKKNQNILVKDDLSAIENNNENIKNIREKKWCTPYTLPSTSILSIASSSFDGSKLIEEATNKAKKLNEVFFSFGIKANVNSFEIGPTISTFKISLVAGIKTTKVTNLEDNLKLTLGAEYIRIVAPVPGTSFIGIEVPNSIKKPVPFKVVYDKTINNKEGIQISIGQDVSGNSSSFDLTKAPHLLVAGSTGSGKSVAINTILASILLRYKPTDVQLILVDPKMVEFAPFHGVPHLMAEVITDANNANNALKAMVVEMEDRYKIMAENGVKKLEELNEKLISEGKSKIPYIVIIIDELADLMMVSAKEVEESIMRITQKARAAGIHMVLATQRPSVEIITGIIKSNIPSRMAFTVASSIDSRTILGQVGAEKLIGMGDMLISLYGQLPFRAQGAYISNEEIEDITSFVKGQCEASYIIDVEKFSSSLMTARKPLISINDPIYIAAKNIVISHQKASTSMIQRYLNIGYNKAANIIETLESEGVIGSSKGTKPREILEKI